MKYVKANTQVILFDNSDVVTASPMGGDEWDQKELDKEYGCDGLTNHVEKNF